MRDGERHAATNDRQLTGPLSSVAADSRQPRLTIVEFKQRLNIKALLRDRRPADRMQTRNWMDLQLAVCL